MIRHYNKNQAKKTQPPAPKQLKAVAPPKPKLDPQARHHQVVLEEGISIKVGPTS